MSFTDGKPFVVTEESRRAPWSGGKNGECFRCYLCGYKFKLGDTARWQFTNNIPGAGGNPLVCTDCDGPDVIERWIAMHREWENYTRKQPFWWFRRRRCKTGD